MKKATFFLIILFGIFPLIKSQTVDSIKIEQAGDLIKIHYKILNSTPDQVFRVNVFCSINGGLPSVLKSLSGDFGDNVVGGRSDYMVLWDVLKDVDEVKSVDFSVRAEMISDNSPRKSKNDKKHSNNFNIMVSAQLPGPGFGIRAGYMGNFGFSVQYIRGKAVLIPDSGYPDEPNLNHINLDITKRIINKESFQMHIIFVGGTGQAISKSVSQVYPDYNIQYVPEFGLGFAFGLPKSTFELVFSHLFYDLVNDETSMSITNRTFLALSFGLRF